MLKHRPRLIRAAPTHPTSYELSADDILKHFPVQRQIGDDLLQPGILIFQSFEPPHLVRQQARILLAPIEIRRLAIPAFRQISATGTPSSPCFKMNAFCASENFDLPLLFPAGKLQRKTPVMNWSSFWGSEQCTAPPSIAY